MKAAYVAIEGIDGSGKDTQLGLLAAQLDRAGITPIVLHEPSFGEHGRALRERMRDLPAGSAEQRALFTRDREDHALCKIRPALALVRANPAFALLQNRSLASAAAYQPYGNTDDDLRRAIEEQTLIAPMPDLVLILDVSVETALQRIARRGPADDLERAEVLAGVRDRYRRLPGLFPNCMLVDGEGSQAAVAGAIAAAIGLPSLTSP